MQKKWLWAAGIVLAIGGLVAVNVIMVGKKVEVVTATASTGVLSESVFANGRVTPASEHSLYTHIGGKIEAVLVKEGDAVKQGDVVLRFDTEEWQRQLDAEQNQLAIARLQRETERKRNFETVRGQTDTAEADKVRDAEKSAQALYELQIEATERNIETLERQIRDNVVKAEADGVVTGVSIQPGATVPAGFEALRLADLSSLVVEAALNELDAGKVHVGMKAVVTGDAFEQQFDGELSYIAPVARPGADGFDYEVPVKVTLAKAAVEAKVMKPGYAATLEFVLPGEEQVLTPLDAVVYQGQDAFLFRAVDDEAVRVPVTVGKDDGERIEILSGLEAGEPYIHPVPEGLREGDKLKAAEQ